MHKQNWYGRCIKILTETDNLYVFSDVYSDTLALFMSKVFSVALVYKHASCVTVLSGLWFWFDVIGKDITAELLANNVVEPTKCFLQEPQVLFQYNSSHTAPVSTPH